MGVEGGVVGGGGGMWGVWVLDEKHMARVARHA